MPRVVEAESSLLKLAAAAAKRDAGLAGLAEELQHTHFAPPTRAGGSRKGLVQPACLMMSNLILILLSWGGLEF